MDGLVLKFGIVLLLLLGGGRTFAQESGQTGDPDDSSTRTEQTDESYRRQMELEDARDRDRTYIDSTYTQKADLEKIDKLPEESRDNIRDQLVDIIMENGEWEPKDALEEYPYTPTAAAEADPDLKQQEQEAWDEQIQKYHEREAAAFGTYRGPVPGPGNPSGQEGGQQGQDAQQGQQGGQQGSGQAGQSGEGSDASGSSGTYQPYQSSSTRSEDEISTAGVSESALDFLTKSGGRQQQVPGTERPIQETAETAETAEASETPEPDTRGIIAIEDLDKLEGAVGSNEDEGQDDS